MPEKSFLEKLQASFPAQTKSDWATAASTELSGKDALEFLQWEVADVKSKFSPYYDQRDLQQLAGQHASELSAAENSFLGSRTWHGAPYVVADDEKNANTISHNHVMCGADGILFDITKKDLSVEKLLENIEWPYCHLSFIQSADFSFVKKIARYCLSKSYNPNEIGGSIFWKKNPIIPEAAFLDLIDFKKFYTLGIYLDRAQPVEELANGLTRAVDLIHSQINKKETAAEAARRISFSLPVGNNFLIEIAKLKALRMLWYQVTQAFGCSGYDANELHIHARCEPWVAETFQPHGNMLKSTTSAISAICGGCNSLTIMSETYGNPIMERMARNTSVILREECHLNKVADPLAGSYAVESITRELAREAWQRFQSATR